jgi:large subunit ribosomal protein L3
MKGIVGKKVGGQIFDEETGSLTPVTVIQARPCRRLRRTQGADGYDSPLAYDEVPSGS